MKSWVLKLAPVADFLFLPFIYPSAWLLKLLRRVGIHRFPRCMSALISIGVFPIRNHYYEPQFDFRGTKQSKSPTRTLTGIDWNVDKQLELLSQFIYADELADIAEVKTGKLDFHLKNGVFESGDAEYWYQLIRAKKPNRIIEIGSGHSTLMAMKATRRNREQDPNCVCEHVCVEPYENLWLESVGISVVREKVEDLMLSFFSQLGENDILFIDSSHMIRPRGDVLFEFLELLPSLKKGVVVHVHDIFSPNNYPKDWVEGQVRFWNEQYLLEAFMSHNTSWEVIGALNFLHHKFYDRLKSVAPFLTPDREPGSFYIQRTA